MKAAFVGGADRSGTTMLGAVLGSANRAVATPESQFVADVYRLAMRRSLSVAETWGALTAHPRFKLWEIVPPDQPPLGSKLDDSTYAAMVLELVKQFARKRTSCESPKIWVDHTPTNTRNAALIFRLFPGAKMIHVVRDGRAIAASFRQLFWGPNSVYATARWWPQVVCFGLAAELQFGTDRVFFVRYEDILNEPVQLLQRICSFAEIEYERGMATGRSDFKVPRFSREQHALVGQGLDASRINAWQESVSRREIEIFESTTFDLLEMLGYEPMFPRGAAPIRVREKLKYFFLESAKNVAAFSRVNLFGNRG